MSINRRQLLGVIALQGMSATSPAAASRFHLSEIGLQLYTVRDLLKLDFEGTLERIAALGYRQVEFAGILGANVTGTYSLLRKLNLTAPSLHVDYTTLQQDAEASFDTARALHAHFVVCSSVDEASRRSVTDWKMICENLNNIGKRAARTGLTLAYHNHDFEFAQSSDGVRPFDLLLSRTDERFVAFELDTYWAKKGKIDPVAFLRVHSSRFRLLHLKDMAPDGTMTELGAGTIDFREIIRASLAIGVRHFFVEQDDAADPLKSIATSIAYLQQNKRK